MNRALLPLLISSLLLSAAVPPARAADSLSAHDKHLIDTLLQRLGKRKDLHFIREDKTYDAKAAAWYLRFKWDHNKSKVHSIEDFINLASTGGDHGEVTYYVQFDDGHKEPAKAVLEDAVKMLQVEEAQKK